MTNNAYSNVTFLGRIYLGLGLIERADSVLRIAAANSPSEPVAHFLLGQSAELGGNDEEVERRYMAAIERNYPGEEAYSLLVQFYIRQNSYDDARLVAERWNQTFVASDKAPFFLGLSLIMSEDFAQANVLITQSLERNPNNPLAIYYLATTYRHLGNPLEARRLAQQAAGMDTLFALPYLEMVYLAADDGDHVEAKRAAKEYIRRAPADSALPYLQLFLNDNP